MKFVQDILSRCIYNEILHDTLKGSLYLINAKELRILPRRHSLLVGDWGSQTLFGFAKRRVVYLWVRYAVHNRYIFGVPEEKI